MNANRLKQHRADRGHVVGRLTGKVILNYCNTFYTGIALKLVWKLQLVQNIVARLVSGMNKFNHILSDLVWPQQVRGFSP